MRNIHWPAIASSLSLLRPQQFAMAYKWRLSLGCIGLLCILALLAVAMSGCSSSANSLAASAPSPGHTPTTVQVYNQAEALRTSGHCDRAIALYLRAITQNSMYVSAYRSLGYCYEAANIGDFKAAILMFDKAIQIDPQSFGIYLDRANAEVANGSSGAAIDDDFIALRLAPHQVPSYISIANAFGEATDLSDEITALTKAIEVAPDSPSLYQQRANIYLSISDPGHAIKDYNTALKITLSTLARATIYNSLADLYSGQQDYGSASNAMNAAITLQPQNSSYYVKAGGIRQNMADFVGALKLYDQGLRYAQTWSDREAAYEGKGDTFVKMGQAQHAIAEYTQAAKQAKDSGTQTRLAGKLADQADTYSGQQDYRSAIELSALAIQLQPKNSSFYARSGSIDQSAGKYSDALARYTQAIHYAQLQPDAETAYEGQGDVYAALDQAKNAIAAYRKASSLANDSGTRSRLTSKIRTMQARLSK